MTFHQLYFSIFYLDLFRYLFLAGGFYLSLFFIFPSWTLKRKIQKKDFAFSDISREFLFSFIHVFFTCAIFAVFFFYFYDRHRVYSDFSKYGLIWPILSLFILLLVHDAYFYWSHRFLHSRFMMKYVHFLHHKSLNPSPFAAYCFHPIESVIQMIWILPIFLVLPLYSGVVAIFYFISLLFNTIGHSGVNLYPPWFLENKYFRYVNTPKAHNQHHEFAASNYALYFRFWDFFMKTNSERKP